ncbi:hypothetical protein [Archangium minus]
MSRGWPYPEAIAATAPGHYLVAYIDADASGGPRVKLRRVTEG